MGCAPSAPHDVDILPIKAQCRTAFARCSTTEQALLSGHVSERHLCQQPDAEGHDVVLCYPMGGTVFGLELQARYEKMSEVSLWTLEHFLSAPGTPLHAMKSMSGGPRSGFASQGLEIKPVPEDTAAAAASPPNQLLAREVRLCRRGVVVLVTAGSTWDDGVLHCLRLTGKYLRPLVLVHCVQSCPLPALEEWPQDVRPLIAASGPPVKYLTQHSTEALKDVELRMVAAAEAAAAAAAAAAAVAASQQTLTAPNGSAAKHIQVAQPARPAGTQLQPTQQHQRKPSQQQQQLEPQPAKQQPEVGSHALLSLAALQASGSAVCARASQLLGPWVANYASRGETNPSTSANTNGSTGSSGGRPSTNGLGSRADSAVTTTLVEAIVTSPPRNPPSYTSITPRVSGQRPPAGAPAPVRASSTGMHIAAGVRSSAGAGAGRSEASVRGGVGGGAQKVADGSMRPGRGSGGASCRCILRYCDRHWATPVAYVCAQLEEELGRTHVSIQHTALLSLSTPCCQSSSGGVSPVSGPVSGPSTAAGAGAARGMPAGVPRAARLNLQSADSWRATSPSPSLPLPPQQQLQSYLQQQNQNATRKAAGPAAQAQPGGGRGSCGDDARVGSSSAMAMAAPDAVASVAIQLSRRASSGHCSAGSGEYGCRQDVVLSTASASGASAGAASSRNGRSSVDDELLAFTTASSGVDDCGVLALQSPVPTASAAAAAITTGLSKSLAGAAGDTREPHRGGFGTRSWTAAGGEGGCEHDGVCVYFVSPGLSAPARCLEEVTGELELGRRVILVVDGECCQRLPEYPPVGCHADTWKDLKRLWHERLLYVQDYHTSFCALLKHGVIFGGGGGGGCIPPSAPPGATGISAASTGAAVGTR